MKQVFRPVAFWKSAVMTMQDNSFFELMRSVLGKIKTPFNKQQLINDLESFLLREEIQKNIAAYINSEDAKVIASVALFGEPAPGELESFFTGELNYAQLQDIIVNLEERFILYRFREDNITRLALNPVLEQILTPLAGDTSSLFPAVSNHDAISGSFPARQLILNDRLLAALLSFVLMQEPVFKAEGIIRKKTLDAANACFPEMDLGRVLSCLQVLGLFYETEDKLLPDKNLFTELALLGARERREYCAAALLVFNDIRPQTEILAPVYRGKIREAVNFIHCFMNSLEPSCNYPEKTILRLAEILKAKTNTTADTNIFLEVLEQTGLLITVTAEVKQCGVFADNDKKDEEKPVIAIDSGFSVLVYPEIDYADAIALASVSRVKEAINVFRFELDKESAVRAFDTGTSADEIIALLNRLSGGRVEEALSWNLKDWEKRHKEVSLNKGVVLQLAEDRRYLTQTMPLAELISQTLAPGVYLLPENAMEEAAAALADAGIDIIARNSRKKTAGGIAAQKHFPPPEAHSPPAEIFKIPASGVPVSSTGNQGSKGNQSSALTENFHAILENMTLDESSRAELCARIDRRLILCDTQLKEAVIRYEKLEARNMDYTGKQNIAKQALAQKSPVEIETNGKRIYGMPVDMEKINGKHILIIVPEGESDELHIPLEKMSLLRRIKKSIFT